MKDYIDREAAIAEICVKGTQKEQEGVYTMTMAEIKQAGVDIISSLPSADVKPVVLCKNCMCYDSRNFFCEHFDVEMGREDYCSYGY